LASLDIGIDLGTSTIIAGNTGRGVMVKEPSVVAVNNKTGQVLAIGAEVYKMIGRTPENITVIRPMSDGVISNYKLTGVLIKHVLRSISKNQLIKPRVIVCVPSAITGVESQSVMEATVEAGARRVHLIEEPVAAALGAGLDITKPYGHLIVDIGGGTTDVAVLSLKGVVCKTSIRTAGSSFDDAITRYIRGAYNLLIGEKTAEEVKIKIGGVLEGAENISMDVKGRDVVSGLPAKVHVSRGELIPHLREIADQILAATQSVLERTPPELVGDIRSSGIVLTGGGALINGMDRFIASGTKVDAQVAENTVECVALGTMKSFSLLGELFDGFLDLPSHSH
jgi:rod shape-determining protein MreB